MFGFLADVIGGAATAHVHHQNLTEPDDRRHVARAAHRGAAWVSSGEPGSARAAGYAGHTAHHIGDRPAGCGW